MTTKTIKPSGGDFTSLTAWVASLPATFTVPEQADVYNFGSSGLVETAGVAFSGFTTTSTNKFIINVPSTERHTGVQHTGAYVTNGGASVTTTRLGTNVDYFDIQWFEIESTTSGFSAHHWATANTAGSNSLNMYQCLVHGADDPIGAFNSNGIYIYRNCIIYSTAAVRIIDLRGVASCELSGCTIYTQGGDFPTLADSNTTAKDCYAGGASNTCWGFTGSPLGSNNAASDTSATATFGAGSVNSVAGSSVFTSVTSGSEDFHLVAGANALVDAGTTVAALTIDVIGTTRPQGSAYDIGAFERLASGLTLALTGVSATSAVGNIDTSQLTTLAVTGVSATSAVGNIGTSQLLTLGLTGVQANTAVGNVGVIAGGDKTFALTGVQAQGQVGQVVIPSAAGQGGHFLPLTEKQLRQIRKQQRKERRRGEDRDAARLADAQSIEAEIRALAFPAPVKPANSSVETETDNDDEDLELILLHA